MPALIASTFRCEVVSPACPKRHQQLQQAGLASRARSPSSAAGSAHGTCRAGEATVPRAAVAAAADCPKPSALLAQTSVSSRRPGGRCQRAAVVPAAAASAPQNDDLSPSSSDRAPKQASYTLEDTRILVETAMLAAVSGLAYLISTILKLENSLGYFLPLPVVLAALRGGPGAGWRTMTASCLLLVVLLGPLRALSYLFLHGLMAATLGSLWCLKTNFWLSVVFGALVRMVGQLSYLVMSSVAMNENMFALLLSNVYNMLDQIVAALGMTGAPSPTAVNSMMFSLLLVNGLTYCFLVHVVYRVVLGTMGYQLGPLPGIVSKYLKAGVVERDG